MKDKDRVRERGRDGGRERGKVGRGGGRKRERKEGRKNAVRGGRGRVGVKDKDRVLPVRCGMQTFIIQIMKVKILKGISRILVKCKNVYKIINLPRDHDVGM